MAPDRDDVQSMVGALFTLTAGLDRARRQRPGAAALSLLQVLADRDGIRPSELADVQAVHPSLVTRQVRDLEDRGFVRVAADPGDGRSWLVALTPAGRQELARLRQAGVDRFALFVADWEPREVRTLAGLLDKLRESMAAVGAQERPPLGHRERGGGPGRARRAATAPETSAAAAPDRGRTGPAT
jgi:DNA-binding MarR family transcriptional regulator